MKSYFYILLLFVCTFYACSGGGESSAPAASAGTGNLEGFSLTANPNSSSERAAAKNAAGDIIEQGEVVNGKREGTWLTFYDGRKAGVIKTATSYINNVIQGAYLTFDNIGRLELRCSYSNGELHGPYIKYKYGKPIEEANYNKGQLDGMYLTYYQNGMKQQETEYKNGKKDGRSVFYNEQEEIIMDYQYKNNEKVDGGTVKPPSTAVQ